MIDAILAKAAEESQRRPWGGSSPADHWTASCLHAELRAVRDVGDCRTSRSGGCTCQMVGIQEKPAQLS